MKTRTLKVWLGIGLLAVVAVSVRAADDPPKTAAATVNHFFALLKAGNFNEAARYFAPVPPLGVDAAEILKKIADDLKSGQKTVTLIDSKEDGDLAVVILKILDKDKSFDHMPSAMLRKDGLWRIYPSSVPKKKKDEKKDVRPDDDNYGQPDIELKGAARKKMNWLWSWAMERCEELNMASKQPVKPGIPRAEPKIVKSDPTGPIRSWAKAFTSKDPADVLQLYEQSDRLVVILSSGQILKGYPEVKDMYEKSSREITFFESEVSEETASVRQGTAWVTCRHRAKFRVRTDGSKWQLEVRTTFVLTPDKDTWRIVLEHSSPIAGVPRTKPLPEKGQETPTTRSGVCAAVNPPKTAADTFNRILALLKAGDIDAAAKYFNAPDPEMAEGLKRAANRLQSGQLTVTWVDSKEEGDLAVVIVKVVDADQGGEAGALYEANAMRRTDGTWRVYPTKRRAEATEKEGKGVAEGKPEAPPKPKKDVPPSLGEPDIKLEGADKEKMAVLWQWAQARCAELSKDSKKPPRPEVPPAGDVKQTKEWQALNRLVGSWEDQVTVTIPERKQGRWSITTAWILGDRFIQAKSQSDLDNSEAVSLYTYDLNRRVLRAWWFSSLGFSASFTGSWDEAASTFTFKVDDAGPGSSTVTSRFIDDDHREWKVITKDADGKVVYEMSGKSIRQKKPMEKPAPDGLAQPGNVDFKQTKEWKALNRLVGSWDYLVTFSNPKTNQGRISSTAAWTLGDRFLQFKSRRGNNIESMSLLTYDPNRGVIRWWYFSSLGQTTGFSGVWDETTNTFTFKEQETGPMTSISIDHFIDDDHRELKDIIKGPDGKVVFEMTYKGTRQKRTGQAPGKAQGAVNPPSAGAAGS